MRYYHNNFLIINFIALTIYQHIPASYIPYSAKFLQCNIFIIFVIRKQLQKQLFLKCTSVIIYQLSLFRMLHGFVIATNSVTLLSYALVPCMNQLGSSSSLWYNVTQTTFASVQQSHVTNNLHMCQPRNVQLHSCLPTCNCGAWTAWLQEQYL